MRKRLILVLTVVVAGFLAASCGDDGGSVFETTTTASGTTSTAGPTTSGSSDGGALARMVSGAVAESTGGTTQAPSAAGGGEELCITTGLAGAIGAERFAELDVIAAGTSDIEEVFMVMTDDELSALVDVMFSCLDTEEMLTQELLGEDFSEEAASCFADALSRGDTMKDLMMALLRGEDPATSPETVRIMVEIMTRDCVAPFEAMLVEEFMADGASAESAACVAREFMRGGLAEVVLGAELSGVAPESTAEFEAEMQRIILSCLTPDELDRFGG